MFEDRFEPLPQPARCLGQLIAQFQEQVEQLFRRDARDRARAVRREYVTL
jgi:hypothetical protein